MSQAVDREAIHGVHALPLPCRLRGLHVKTGFHQVRERFDGSLGIVTGSSNPEDAPLGRLEQHHLHRALAVDTFIASRDIGHVNIGAELRREIHEPHHRTRMQAFPVRDRNVANNLGSGSGQ